MCGQACHASMAQTHQSRGLSRVQGSVLSPRRGHACTVINDRHIVVTGGYDGTQHLGEVGLLDTHDAVWRRVEMTGEPHPHCCPAADHKTLSVEDTDT